MEDDDLALQICALFEHGLIKIFNIFLTPDHKNQQTY
jgi:hypothetical protein